MNADLEETLKELGPGYRAVVDRLRAAPTAAPEVPVRSPFRPGWWLTGALAAASLALICTLLRPHLEAPPPSATPVATVPAVVAPAALSVEESPYTLALSSSPDAIAEIVRTQEPDGSWQSDYLTRQNAAALRGVATASVAYRKAVRYLRTKGLSPLSDGELRARGELRHRAV